MAHPAVSVVELRHQPLQGLEEGSLPPVRFRPRERHVENVVPVGLHDVEVRIEVLEDVPGDRDAGSTHVDRRGIELAQGGVAKLRAQALQGVRIGDGRGRSPDARQSQGDGRAQPSADADVGDLPERGERVEDAGGTLRRHRLQGYAPPARPAPCGAELVRREPRAPSLGRGLGVTLLERCVLDRDLLPASALPDLEAEVVEVTAPGTEEEEAEGDAQRALAHLRDDLALRPLGPSDGAVGHAVEERSALLHVDPEPQVGRAAGARGAGARVSPQADRASTIRAGVHGLREGSGCGAVEEWVRAAHTDAHVRRAGPARSDALVLPGDHVGLGVLPWRQARVGPRRTLSLAVDPNRRRDRRDEPLQPGREVGGVGRALHAAHSEHRVPIPIDRGGLVARVEVAKVAVQAREDVGALDRGVRPGLGPRARAPGDHHAGHDHARHHLRGSRRSGGPSPEGYLEQFSHSAPSRG